MQATAPIGVVTELSLVRKIAGPRKPTYTTSSHNVIYSVPQEKTQAEQHPSAHMVGSLLWASHSQGREDCSNSLTN